MEIKINIKGPSLLAAAFEKLPFDTHNKMRLAMLRGMRDIQETARTQHRFTSRTATLERAVETKIVSDSPLVGSAYINEVMAPYGKYIHKGTKAHFIRPRTRKALRFVGAGGKFFFSKGHMVRGIEADPFLLNAAKKNETSLNAIFDKAVSEAIKGAGL